MIDSNEFVSVPNHPNLNGYAVSLPCGATISIRRFSVRPGLGYIGFEATIDSPIAFARNTEDDDPVDYENLTDPGPEDTIQHLRVTILDKSLPDLLKLLKEAVDVAKKSRRGELK